MRKSYLMYTVCLMLLCGCAASHKTVRGTMREVADNISTVHTDSTAVSAVSVDSVSQLFTASGTTSSTATETGENEETVHERITETVDSAGVHMVVTDRTIKKRGGYTASRYMSESVNFQQQIVQSLMSRIDSMRRAETAEHAARSFKTDSISTESVRQGRGEVWTECLRWLVIAFVAVGVCYELVSSKLKNRKS